MAVRIRPERPADADAVAAVVEAAFADPALARLVAELRDEPSYRTSRALVAVDGERVVGYVLVTDSVLTSPDGDDVGRVATLSPLAVAPDRQRQGIGAALVAAVLAACDAEGEPAVVLEGDPGYYGRLGFEAAAPHGLVHPLPDWAPPEAAQLHRLAAWTGALRGTVTYSPPFDRLPH
ncbi:MAG TPA: N-acetyltransferase [Iamia sp.]